jgi:hypothetical protein
MTVPTIDTEVMLLDWSESAKGGAKIVLQLPNAGELEPFKAMTLARKGVAGQRLMAVFALVNDEEQPEAVPEKPATPPTINGQRLSTYAAMLCQSERFGAFLKSQFPDTYRSAFDTTKGNWPAAAVRSLCKVNSRAEFDTDPEAAERFHGLRKHFAEWAPSGR